ncbi:MAG: hypothetical protein ACLPYY_06450 [Acidimicrobiales bacterium]
MTNNRADPHVSGHDWLNRNVFVSVADRQARGAIDEEVWLAE